MLAAFRVPSPEQAPPLVPRVRGRDPQQPPQNPAVSAASRLLSPLAAFSAQARRLSPNQNAIVNQLMAEGFSETHVRDALHLSGNDVSQAKEMLIMWEKVPPPTPPPPQNLTVEQGGPVEALHRIRSPLEAFSAQARRLSPSNDTVVAKLVNQGFTEDSVHNALSISGGNATKAAELLETWKRVPPPTPPPPVDLSGKRPSTGGAGVLRRSFDRFSPRGGRTTAATEPMPKSIGHSVRKSIKKGAQMTRDVNQELKSMVRRVSGEGLAGNRDGYADFYGYEENTRQASSNAAPTAVVHLPSQDDTLPSPRVGEAPKEPLAAVDPPSSAGGVTKNPIEHVWGVLCRMSAMPVDEIVIGRTRSDSGSNEKRMSEVNALLSRGWLPPENVRGLKKELEELHLKVADAERSHPATPASGTKRSGASSGTASHTVFDFSPALNNLEGAQQTDHCISSSESSPQARSIGTNARSQFHSASVPSAPPTEPGSPASYMPRSSRQDQAPNFSVNGEPRELECDGTALSNADEFQSTPNHASVVTHEQAHTLVDSVEVVARTQELADDPEKTEGEQLSNAVPVRKMKPPPKGKGKGKGKPPPPKAVPAPGKGSGKQAASVKAAAPFGRRFNWRSVPEAKVAGTVFQGLREDSPPVDVARLRALFEKPESSKKVATGAPKRREEVKFLTHQRAQNVAIIFKRRPLTDTILLAIQRLDFEAEGMTPENCELLLGAVPTHEEAQSLLGYRGNIENLRSIERQLLPLAQMEPPSAGSRLRLVTFGGTMAELASNVREGILKLRFALADVRQSPAFRTTLLHTMRLGNFINHGAEQANQDVVVGFALDDLPKLSHFKATSNSRITLMHILVTQLSAADQNMPATLLDELNCVHSAAKQPLAQLTESLATFRREAEFASSCLAAVSFTAAVENHHERLADLSQRANTESDALQSELATLKDVARDALKFFAVAAQPNEVDAKTLELFSSLSDFLVAFKACMREVEKRPELAKECRQ
eukprot:TRINITY_DN43267_c0_g1_i1.p1 TRINITY_DN43267_c0_g1~~TRINITY_DN43267_c0_g1_i1.p1  ORF type:complete len:1000 (-),score=158.25 TRINITY_DN43267_c0_g1_i1:199-3198(-)